MEDGVHVFDATAYIILLDAGFCLLFLLRIPVYFGLLITCSWLSVFIVPDVFNCFAQEENDSEDAVHLCWL